jgi:ATP-dependent Clp endopeptidase proteolytic subunit ClpP
MTDERPDRELHPSEVAKNEAEAEAIRLKAQAEVRKMEAEAAKAEAERRVLEIEAETDAARMVAVIHEAERAEEKRAEEKAAHKYHHVYLFKGAVDGNSATKCMDQLTTWMRNDPKCDIEIIFHSPGGSVVDGMALWDHIQMVRAAGHKVTTSTVGMAASMAGILLEAGDVRIMGRESWLLIHEASFSAGGSFGDVEDTVDWVRRVQDRILSIFAERSNMTKAQIKRRWHRKDWWISSDEALKLGLIDQIR